MAKFPKMCHVLFEWPLAKCCSCPEKMESNNQRRISNAIQYKDYTNDVSQWG